ncbi:uncharacterized protein TNCV_3881891 [Trichonephila clavipes]|nr:uncharacterized protein TNCV_3881891 [Trichonephila clavipes]
MYPACEIITKDNKMPFASTNISTDNCTGIMFYNEDFGYRLWQPLALITASQSSRWCSCLDGAVRLARTIDLEGYTGGSLLLVGSPKPGRPKGKCQTKRNTTTSQDRLLPSWCSDLYDLNRSCLLPLPMMLLTQNFDAASPITQINQGRACDLGRGLQMKSKIWSPHSTHNLKILQCNINGLTSPATRIKLDQLLEIALKQDVKVIAVQETKLKESTALKVKGFNIFRVDRKSKSGGGLAFFVRDINYQRIENPTD